ncbi:ABC transporter permease [Cellulomonas sp.]|uniref:ABC transporter permease n=1 Tax=Cellulomonas sp. TaxID=40001 RepID=UPI001B0EB95F|nr:ABC transporter permease [Cellulomonas sp.]MBO9553989.1 ABC transporter permease [Cellulomonas sp.]
MTTVSAPAAPLLRPRPIPTHVTARRAVRSEWIKLTSLRSTWITAATLAVTVVGIGLLATSTTMSSATTATAADLFGLSLTGTAFAVLVVGALGAVVGAREHASGMIRTTLAAVPRRGITLLAKSVALAGIVVPTLVAAYVGSVLAANAVIGGAGLPTVAVTDPLALRAIGGAVLYLTSVTLIGLALGSVLRSVAGAVAGVAGLVLVLPIVAGLLLPASWAAAADALPSVAGEAVTAVSAGAQITPLAGAADLVAWVVVALGVATVLLRRRDA